MPQIKKSLVLFRIEICQTVKKRKLPGERANAGRFFVFGDLKRNKSEKFKIKSKHSVSVFNGYAIKSIKFPSIRIWAGQFAPALFIYNIPRGFNFAEKSLMRAK